MKIKDVCDLINGRAFKPTDWSSEGIPIVRIQNLNDQNAPFNYFQGVYSDVHEINDGELLFSWSGTPGTSFGAFRWYRGKGVLNQHIFRVIPKIAVDKDYLKYALNGNLQAIISKAHGGVGLQHITKKELDQIDIPIPPEEQQRHIVTCLHQNELIIAMCEEQLHDLDQLIKARCVEMFGDCKTNPKGWKTVALGEISEVGSSKRVFVEELKDKGIPFYRGTEVGALAEGKPIQPELFITDDHYKELIEATGKPEVGDLLMPSICPDGRIWVVDKEEPFYFKDGRVLWVHAIKHNFNPVFLLYTLKDRIMTDYGSIASGTTFAELKIFALKGCRVFDVPMQEQNRFAEFISQVDKSKVVVQEALDKAQLLFDSLMQQYFG